MESIDEAKCGLKGSPTNVKKTYTPNRTYNCTMIEDEDPKVEATKLADLLKEAKVL